MLAPAGLLASAASALRHFPLDTLVLDNRARQNLEVQQDVENNGEPGGTRTRDPVIKSHMLYH